MRIDIVTDTYYPDVNGVAMTLGRLVEGLREAGHYVTVFHTGLEPQKGEKKLKGVELPGYPEVRIGLPSQQQLFLQ